MSRDSQEYTLTAHEQETLLRLARLTLRTYLSAHRKPDPAAEGIELTETLKATGAAFVTLKIHGRLRGCIGHIVGFEPLYESVINNTISAATRDPRFPAMSAAEEPQTNIEISAMSPIRTITDIEEIQVGVHGLIIEQHGARGLLLPQVATDYGWDRIEFLENTCYKAGLPRDAWEKGASIAVFSAQVFGEAE